jgi:hypothetical protein
LQRVVEYAAGKDNGKGQKDQSLVCMGLTKKGLRAPASRSDGRVRR